MAKILFGNIVADARGSIGGVVYSRNTFGAYTRQKVTPVNPNTPAQTAQRARFANAANDWVQTLTEAQRQTWDQYASAVPIGDIFGNSVARTGFNMYIRQHTLLALVGGTPATTAPAVNAQAPITTATLTQTAGNIEISLQTDISPVLAVNDTLIISEAPNIDGSRDFIGRNQHKYLLSLTSVSVEPMELRAAGDVTSGKIYSYAFRRIDTTGLVSPLGYARITAA